jgi:predicted peptidase
MPHMKCPLLQLFCASLLACAAFAAETKPAAQIIFNADTQFPSAPGYKVLKAKARYQGQEFPIACGLFLPASYFKIGRQFPLIVTLHNVINEDGGSDGGPQIVREGLALLLLKPIGSDNRHTGWMPPNPVNVCKDAYFIGLVPQCPKDMDWDRPPMSAVVIALIDEIGKRYRMDQDAVYCTGFSHGGTSSWALAMAYPDRFAAIVPIDGRLGPEPEKAAERLKKVGVWIGYGEYDGEFAKNCQEMYDRLKKGNHPNVQLQVIKGAQHHSYSAVYGWIKFWDWLYAQKRKK